MKHNVLKLVEQEKDARKGANEATQSIVADLPTVVIELARTMGFPITFSS